MKKITTKVDANKLLVSIPNSLYENEAVLNTTYKFTNKCYINIEPLETVIEVYFQSKGEDIDLDKIALEFGNELIDQQIRLNTGKEFKLIREELVKKAFSSITK